MKYSYFVVFKFYEHGMDGEANIHVERTKRISTMDEIKKMEAEIEETYGYDEVLITNWRRFEDED